MKNKKIFYYALTALLCIITFFFTRFITKGSPETQPSGTVSVQTDYADTSGTAGTADVTAPTPAADTAVPATPDHSTGLRVHFLDVGQGDSTLIESDGHYMLIDAGEYDQADTVIGYLNDQKITRLDYVIGTHPHSDHIGALDEVIKTFDIGQVILPEKEHTTRAYRDMIKAISSKKLTITRPVVGDTYELGGASFQILAPNADYGDNLNNWSVGIRLTYEDTAFVLCGDAEVDAEHDMLANGLELSADVLKLSHHGSYTSTINKFLDRVNPTYAVIECGSDNPYGYPHKEIKKKMEKRNIEVYRTDTQGNIVATSDGTHITWTTEE